MKTRSERGRLRGGRETYREQNRDQEVREELECRGDTNGWIFLENYMSIFGLECKYAKAYIYLESVMITMHAWIFAYSVGGRTDST